MPEFHVGEAFVIEQNQDKKRSKDKSLNLSCILLLILTTNRKRLIFGNFFLGIKWDFLVVIWTSTTLDYGYVDRALWSWYCGK